MTTQPQAEVIESGITRKHRWGDPDYSVKGHVLKKCDRCPVVKITRIKDGTRSYRIDGLTWFGASPECEGAP